MLGADNFVITKALPGYHSGSGTNFTESVVTHHQI